FPRTPAPMQKFLQLRGMCSPRCSSCTMGCPSNPPGKTNSRSPQIPGSRTAKYPAGHDDCRWVYADHAHLPLRLRVNLTRSAASGNDVQGSAWCRGSATIQTKLRTVLVPRKLRNV